MEDALVAVEGGTLVALGSGTLSVEEGHILDAVEDDTLAVERVANLYAVQTHHRWSWSACLCWKTVWPCFHYTACSSCLFGPNVLYFSTFFCKLAAVHWQLSL